jgi:hypothetical protein
VESGGPRDDELQRSEVEAVLETRRELGSSYDAALVDSFADRVERAVERRTAEELTRREGRIGHAEAAGRRQMTLGIVSVGAGIPISAITLAVPEGVASLGALVVAWCGIVGVNAAHAWQSRADR